MNKKYQNRERLDMPAYEIGKGKNPSGSNKPAYEPSEEEIEALCFKLQSMWSEEETLMRKHTAAYQRTRGNPVMDETLLYSVPVTKVLVRN